MKTYVTFGSGHEHTLSNGQYFDYRTIAVIEAENEKEGRNTAFKLFGPAFCTSYNEEIWYERKDECLKYSRLEPVWEDAIEDVKKLNTYEVSIEVTVTETHSHMTTIYAENENLALKEGCNEASACYMNAIGIMPISVEKL